MKHLLPIMVILLLVSTSFIGMGNQVREMKADNEQDEFLDDLAFYCYDDSGFGSEKYEHLSEELLEEYLYQTNVVETESQSIVSNPIPILSSPPMDSAWPMKCHDTHHTSRSPYSTENNPYDELWSFKTDFYLDDTPIVDSDGTIYFGGGYEGLWRYLFALYPNGSLKWRYKTNGRITGSSPAIGEDGTIYVGSWDNRLNAINPDGSIKWKCNARGSIASSPAIDNESIIYVGTMRGFDEGEIVAINPNGTMRWYYPTGYYITSDPAIGNDGIVYIGSGDTYLYAMNPNGALKWRFKTGDEIHGHPSIAEDGTIYIGSYDDYLYAIYPNGTMRWKFKLTWGTAGNPAISEDGTIYVGSDKLYAIYPNGTLRWSFELGGENWIGHSSPSISADGTIYVGTRVGEVQGGSIIAVNPDGSERWRKKIATMKVDSSPSIGEDGTVYVGATHGPGNSYGVLHAFNRADLSVDADGPYYGFINEPVQFNGTGIGGYRPYSWYWDFGDGNFSYEQNPFHMYTNPDNYTVTLNVTDYSGNFSEDTAWAWIQESNDPPEKPTITGETNGKIKTDYDYQFQSSDPEGLHIWHYIEWGDNQNTGWIGPYDSGETITESHKWWSKGEFTIRCKAKDPYGDESEWGELRVTMPHTFWWLDGLLNRFPLLQRLLEVLIR